MSNQHHSDSETSQRPSAPSSSSPFPFLQTMDLAFLGSLVPGIIHNIATPLSGVLGATQLLEKRVSSIESLLQDYDGRDESSRADLNQHLARNRTNVEILAKNAKHLADILQVIVHRINRGSVTMPELHSLPDLVSSELRFLDANLIFKHKVKKQVGPLSDIPLERYVYGHVAATIDEFVSETVPLHDPVQGQMEMDFLTEETPTALTLFIRSRFMPRTTAPTPADWLDPCLARLREDGWAVELLDEPGRRELRLTRKRLMPGT